MNDDRTLTSGGQGLGDPLLFIIFARPSCRVDDGLGVLHLDLRGLGSGGRFIILGLDGNIRRNIFQSEIYRRSASPTHLTLEQILHTLWELKVELNRGALPFLVPSVLVTTVRY